MKLVLFRGSIMIIQGGGRSYFRPQFDVRVKAGADEPFHTSTYMGCAEGLHVERERRGRTGEWEV